MKHVDFITKLIQEDKFSHLNIPVAHVYTSIQILLKSKKSISFLIFAKQTILLKTPSNIIANYNQPKSSLSIDQPSSKLKFHLFSNLSVW